MLPKVTTVLWVAIQDWKAMMAFIQFISLSRICLFPFPGLKADEAFNFTKSKVKFQENRGDEVMRMETERLKLNWTWEDIVSDWYFYGLQNIISGAADAAVDWAGVRHSQVLLSGHESSC